MKQLVLGLLNGILFLTACGQVSTATQTAPNPLIEQTTATPSLAITQTSFPSSTPTMTITPLPTIPTFTPTFDASMIVMVTPAPKAECPTENPNLNPDLDVLFTRDVFHTLKNQALLDFLNNGGIPHAVITAILQEFQWFDPNRVIQQDVTGDGIAEFILNDNYVVSVFGCKDKKYRTLLSIGEPFSWVENLSFKISDDMNLNGISEIIIDAQGGHAYTSESLSILEWNGSDFSTQIEEGSYRFFLYADTQFPAHITTRDSDGNGTLELIFQNDLSNPVPPQRIYLLPWRNETRFYTWNGSLYVLNRIEYAPPEFRFQAVQDADLKAGYGNFGKALLLYQDIISSNKLKAFSPEIAENQTAKSIAIASNQPIPTSVSADSTEYPHLAAYAYYRIMLLRFVQGNETEATTTYNTLQQKFGSDPYGRPYAEMATAFWESYQSTHKMYDGCAAAIQYAAEHPEILTPLGSDYHGSQSHTYVPADVCPFSSN